MTGALLKRLYSIGDRRDAGRGEGGFEPIGGNPLRTPINRVGMQFGIENDGEWKEQLTFAIEKYGYAVTDDIKTRILKAINTCESPIEKRLFPWLLAQRHWFFDYPSVLSSGNRLRCNCNALAIVPQLRIGQFRVDFAYVWRHGRDIVKVVVECDGAEHHTDKQKDLSRSKNLLAISHVLEIIRFTGSDIYRNPEECAYLAAIAVHGSCNTLRMKVRK